MKRLLTLIGLICSICLSSLAQGAFLVYVKGEEKPTVIPNAAIDTIYFESTAEGKLQQIFATNEGMLSFIIDDIDHIAFNGEKYIKAIRHNHVLPKENTVLNLDFAISGIDRPIESWPEEFNGYYMSGYHISTSLTVVENKGDEREFTIPIDIGGCHEEIHVKQLSESFIKDWSRFGDHDFGRKLAFVNPEKNSLKIPVLSGLDITIRNTYEYNNNEYNFKPKWCRILPEKNGFLTLEFDENTASERRLHGDF